MWNYTKKIEFLKKSEKYSGLEVLFTLEVSGIYKEETFPPFCFNPDLEDYYDPGEEEIFTISDIRVLRAVIYSYPEEDEFEDLLEEIELEVDKDRQQGLIEKLCLSTDIGEWENLQLTDKEEDELKQEILRRIYVY